MSKCLESLIFFIVPEEIVYSLFNFFFDMLWNSIYLNYVPKFGKEELVYNIFLTLKESLTLLNLHLFCPIEVIQRRIDKINTIILMENFDHAICPGLSVLFLHAPAYRAWLFGRFIFQPEAFSNSFKITCILLRQVISPMKTVMSSTKFTNLI